MLSSFCANNICCLVFNIESSASIFFFSNWLFSINENPLYTINSINSPATTFNNFFSVLSNGCFKSFVSNPLSSILLFTSPLISKFKMAFSLSFLGTFLKFMSAIPSPNPISAIAIAEFTSI